MSEGHGTVSGDPRSKQPGAWPGSKADWFPGGSNHLFLLAQGSNQLSQIAIGSIIDSTFYSPT